MSKFGFGSTRSKKSFVKNFGSRVILALGAISVLAAGIIAWTAYSFIHEEFPDVSVLKTSYPVVHYQGKDEAPTLTLSKHRPSGWVTLAEISKVAVGAVIVSEDWAFYQHKGYDANQIKEAVKEDWEEGRFARGASTITQQVTRNVFLSKDKNLWRKLKELYLSLRLEETVGKRKILETYFNVAEWGEGIFGIRAASQFYFGKEPSQLTPREGAFLAMLLPSPKRYGQSFRAKKLTDYARKTVRSILFKMAQAHYITEEERDLQLADKLPFETDTSEGPAPEEEPEAKPSESAVE